MKNIFENKSIENLINGTMQNLHTLIETNTIIGETLLSPDGTVIIPISKVSVGYVVGGGEYVDIAKLKKLDSFPMAGGSGGGVTISPVGFLIEKNGSIEYVDIENKSATENIMLLINKLIKKLCDEGDCNENK